MSFSFVTCDGEGVIYAVTPDGQMLFFRDEARDGTPRWANGGSAQIIGDDWSGFQRVFCGGSGVIYSVNNAGDLFFYKDLARDGTVNWANGGVGQKVGDGWADYEHVISGGGGVIYAIDAAGDMLFFHDPTLDGTPGWASPTEAKRIGSGWGGYKQLISGDNGILYAVNAAGDLLFFQDLARSGVEQWAHGGASQKIGDGWGNFADLIGGGDGIIYAITMDGFLLYYRDLGRDGSDNWEFNGSALTLGSGWVPGDTTEATILGYCVPLSAAPGGTIAFKLSAEAPYSVTYVRLGEQPDGNVGREMGPATRHPARLQSAPVDAWRTGCGWQTAFSLVVPDTWLSGMYAAHCVADDGNETWIVFVVPPAADKHGSIALLANTLTWNAYNDWGGRSKYTVPVGATLSFERPNLPITPIGHGEIDHLARAEMWVLDWLTKAGYWVDVHADTDFDAGIPDFAKYKALVLSTHPEYVTKTIVDNIEAYLAGGGHLVYIGGNGLFEQVVLDRATNTLVAMDDQPAALRDIYYFRNQNPPRPERALLGIAYRYDNYMTFAGFAVKEPNHRFLAGTGLAAEAVIGETGLNGGGGSGWEMDTSEVGLAAAGVVVGANGAADDRGAPPPNTVLLARGTNPGFGADMTCYDHPGGGFVFSAGAISFGGALAVDANLQAILKNVLDEATA